MKKLFLSLMALTITIGASAQTQTNTIVPIINTTNCGFFVSARPIQSFATPYSSCLTGPRQTVYVGPFGTASLPAVAGMHYEAATILDNIASSPTYIVEIQAPGIASAFWWGSTGANPQCYALNTIPRCDAAIGCSGTGIEACWDIVSGAQGIMINN